MWGKKFLERFHMQGYIARATPCEQKLNYTDGVEKMNDFQRHREAV